MIQRRRIIVDGVDLYSSYGLLMTEDSKLSPPMLKRYEVDIPGSNGCLDLTDVLAGDAAFGVREMTMVFAIEAGDHFERLKTSISNLLHGRRLEFRLTDDPDYTYTGRFEIDEYYSKMHAGRIKVGVRAEPYKLLKTCAYRVNAAGGIVVTLESGRMPVCPVFEFSSETIVAAGDVCAQMQPGTYKVNDLWLHEGANELYINSYLGDGNVAVDKYLADTIAEHADERISDLIWEGVRGAPLTIGDWENDTISMHADDLIIDTAYAVAPDSEKFAVYIRYDWKDL